MDAKKCDRCGDFYVEVEANVLKIAINNMWNAFRALTKGEVFSLFEKIKGNADLCVECEKQLRSWCKCGKGE